MYNRADYRTPRHSDPSRAAIFSAKARRKTKGLIKRELQNIQWVGGPLAEELNRDQGLNSLVLEWLKDHDTQIEVQSAYGWHRISAGKEGPGAFTLESYMPTRQQFEAITRIAEHIHSLD